MVGSDSAGKDIPRVKGASLLGFFKYVKEQPEGEQKMARVLATMPAESAGECRKKVIAVAEYPYRVFVDYIRACDRVLGRGDLAVCRQLGEFAAMHDVRSFLKMVKTEPEPGDVFRAASLLWKNYHLHSGRLQVEDATPEHSLLRIHDFPQMDPAHCRLMEGYFTSGLRELQREVLEEFHETRCPSRGDPYHEFAGKWRE